MKQSLIFIATQDPAFAREAKAILEGRGFQIESVANEQEVTLNITQLRPKVVLVDMSQSSTERVEWIRNLQADQLGTTVLVCVATGSDPTVQALLDAGAYDVVTGPLQTETLVPAIRRSAERQELLDELSSLRRALDGTHGCVLGLSETGISLEGVERELLVRALTKFSGNQTRAAKYLDISRRTLIYRMEKFGLRRRETPMEPMDTSIGEAAVLSQ